MSDTARPAETVSESVPAHHETPDVAELRRLRDTEREELHSPTRRLDAYYYSFSETGSVPIDAILSAVAIAGKSCHNTDMWTEDDEWSRWGVGRSLVDVIQCAAYEAAAALLDATAERDALAAAVERVRALHIATPFWQLTPEGYAPDMESTAPDGAMCLACSEEHVTDDFENWELDLSDSGVVHYPCPTIRALDEEPQP